MPKIVHFRGVCDGIDMVKNIKSLYKKCIENFALTSIVLFVIVYVLYVMIMGDNIVMPLHDNLDSNVVWFKMLKDNNAFFTYKRTYLPYLGGFDRNLMSTNLDIYTCFFMLFPVWLAGIITVIVRIVVSVLGMLVLFKEVLSNDDFKNVKNIIAYLGFSFGIFPVFLSGQFGIAFLPLFIFSCIKFYKTRKFKWAIFLSLYAFCSHIILYGMFVCVYFLLFVLYECIRKRKFDFSLFGTFILLCSTVIISQWRLLYYMMYGEESIRGSFKADTILIKPGLLKTFFNVFFKGEVQAGELYTYIIVPVSLVGFCYMIFRHIKGQKVLFLKEMTILILLCLFNSVIYALDTKSNIIYLIVKTVSESLATIQCSRFLYLSPVLWYIVFALLIVNIASIYKNKGIIISYILVFAAIAVIFIKPATYNVVQQNISHVMKLIKGNHDDTTIRSFYAADMFDEIKKDINYSGEWTVAYGFHPAVLEYNEIATLDGYNSVYAKSYKDQFRKLIAPYEEAGGNLAYFDGWGGRAYIFGDVNYLSYYDTEPKELHIDPDVFKEMKGKYVFSRVEVTNIEDNSLELIKKYEDDNTAYKQMFVYKVK